jgi:hypothetical protein
MIAGTAFSTCSAKFYDSGGPNGDYMNNQNSTLTIYPATPGAKVSVTFDYFNTAVQYFDISTSTSNNSDILYVYNGNSAAATQIGALQGQSSYGTMTSTSIDGSLTFKFVSHALNNTTGLKKGWSATITCNLRSTITFLENYNWFSTQTLYTDSKAYLYYYYNNGLSNIIPGTTVAFNLSSNGIQVPCEATGLDGGIFRLSLDLSNIIQPSVTILLPDSIASNGINLLFMNKPSPITKDIKIRPLDQSIDVFAGRSVGADLIAGGVGAGPSIAAAKLSLEGSNGLGLNFNKDNLGNETITRRLEGSITASAETPSINAIAGKIQLGANVSITRESFAGQTMYLPYNLNSTISQKAKAAYVLESLKLGDFELSPFAAIFLKALIKSLVQTNPDINAVYNSLMYSNESGLELEGEVSLGFNIASGEGSNQIKMELLDVGTKFAISGQKSNFVQSGNKSFKLGFARSFSVSGLNFQIGPADFGKVYDFNYGAEFSAGADYSPTNGFNFLKLSFVTTPYEQMFFLPSSTVNSYDFLVPKAAITRNINSSSLLKSISSEFATTSTTIPLKVGLNYYTDQLDSLYVGNPDNLSAYENHVKMQINKSRLKGLDLSLKVDLDAALGIGAGISLGIQGSYFDQLNYPKKEFIIANGNILPMVEYNDVLNDFNLLRFKDELNDLYTGTVSLVADLLKPLVQIYQQAVEAGKAFQIAIMNLPFSIAGTISNAGNFIIRVLDPTSTSIQKALFVEPKIITAYSSHRVIHADNRKGTLTDESASSTLYLVSENINVSLTDNFGNVISTFDPVTLSISIDPNKMAQLNFGDNEKKLARMYYYDIDSLYWIEVPGNSSTNLNLVTTLISRSGSYAIGIELTPSNDITAPQIIDYYPKESASCNKRPSVWAKINDGPTGVGIDFSHTLIKIDGAEVSSAWDPVNGILSYNQPIDLTTGNHKFTVTAIDYNGNKSEISSTFLVVAASTNSISDSKFILSVYPNPATDKATISVINPKPGPVSVDVFNQAGQRIGLLYYSSKGDRELSINWDLNDNKGARVKSGIYYVRIKNNETILVKKLIVN